MKDVPDPQDLVGAPPTALPAQRHDPYAALRYRPYLLYSIGSLISSVGGQMQSVAVGWELYERTGRAMSLGWVGLVQAVPIMILSLPAGQLADRVDRRRIVLASQLMMALCSFGLAAVSYAKGPVEWMYALLFLGAIGRAFIWPASQSLMPHLVPKDIFSNAVTWKSTGFQIASVTGPALGGLMIGAQHSATTVYVADGLMTLVYFAFVLSIASPPMTRSGETASWRTLLAGFDYVRRTKVIMAAITLDLFAVLLGGAVALLPIFAKDILQVGPAGLGWLRAAPAIGAFFMALTLAHRPPMKRAGRTLLWAVTWFGVVTIVFGLSRSFALSLLVLAISGAVDNISVVVRHSLVQLKTPDEMRGRVSAVNSVFISASNELGGFESGLVAAWFGPIVSVVSGGIGTLVVVAVVTLAWPQIRQLGKLNE